MWTSTDYNHMAHALRLAELGLYTTTPNPRVGCVIVKQGKVVGTGWHQRAGEPHAEILALQEAGQQAREATVYVSLEPCSHFGRTPPCANALIAAGVTRVIAAMADPNPLVAGQGLARLAAVGIETSCGLLQPQAEQLNPGFIQRMIRQRPWLRIKTASSLDGKIALANGDSKWISSAASRLDAHRLRARSCAILTGIGTVLNDDPQLNVRDLDVTRQPLKIIVDSQLRTPVDARILQDNGVIIAYVYADFAKQQKLAAQGVELVQMPALDGRVDLSTLLTMLAQRGVNEIMTEAGANLNSALISAGLVDEWVMYLAPTLLGDSARNLFELPAPATMSERRRLSIVDCRQIGTDLRITAQFKAD